jgi:hypothetical protein
VWGKADSEIGKVDSFSNLAYARSANPHVTISGFKSRPREPRQDRGSRKEPLADAGREARSRTGETCGERGEAELEAVGRARIARRRGTARGGHSLAHPIRRRRTDKSR